MGRMSEKRKAELQLKFGDNAFAPIEDKYLEQARDMSARYILFRNKDNRHGYCEKCHHDVEFDKTTHKKEVVCPNCGATLTAQHIWRKPNCDYTIDWFVIGNAIDSDTFALRYIRVAQKTDYTKRISEVAREISDFKNGKSYKFGYVYDYKTEKTSWTINDNYYFQEHAGMSWYIRKECCIGARSLNNIYAELKKINALKYFDQLFEYFDLYYYPSTPLKRLVNAPLYEKLIKVGLSDIAKDDYEDYRGSLIKYKRTETSLIKMLKMNKAQYNMFLSKQTWSVSSNREMLDFIMRHNKMPINDLEFLINNKLMSTYNSVYYMGVPKEKRMKITKYLDKHSVYHYDRNIEYIGLHEYSHYIELLKKLKYDLNDESYLCPKDFRKADKRVSDEYQAMLDREEAERIAKKDGLIKSISDGLRKMPDLTEFLNGSEGLLVYVPESAKELAEEGRKLHNCIGTYVDRIAEKKTLVFFVRRLNAPNDSFVAFEYCNGEIVQCRYDNNQNVDDDKIINFVEAFAERLRKNKVLYKAA